MQRWKWSSMSNFIIVKSFERLIIFKNKHLMKVRLVLQGDHNLVLYDGFNAPIWNTQTNGKGWGNMRLVMQDDANLVLYDQNSQVTI